ncbi:MAG: hypothetical protein HYY18_17445 [Planctomycetes bacterium]|nr:hypothetical protein [Planctomycetota bacterium]
MAAGERCCALGVLRIVTSHDFGKGVWAEMHLGVEDVEGELFYHQLHEVRFDWSQVKSKLGADDYAALLRIVATLEKAAHADKPLKTQQLVKFDPKKADRHTPAPTVL